MVLADILRQYFIFALAPSVKSTEKNGAHTRTRSRFIIIMLIVFLKTSSKTAKINLLCIRWWCCRRGWTLFCRLLTARLFIWNDTTNMKFLRSASGELQRKRIATMNNRRMKLCRLNNVFKWCAFLLSRFLGFEIIFLLQFTHYAFKGDEKKCLSAPRNDDRKNGGHRYLNLWPIFLLIKFDTHTHTCTHSSPRCVR